VSSTRRIAEAAGEDGSAAARQRHAGSGAARWWKRCADLVTARCRSSGLCAVMRGHRCGDRTAIQRSKLKTPLPVPIPRQLIERETKSSGRRGRTWIEVEREIKWIEGRDRAGNEIRRMMWSQRDRADEIERQKRAGKMERMKSQRQICD
jgi:hypothetical protein